MVKVLFICHGNICRSPMAEYIFKDMLTKRGIKDIQAASCATSTEEIGGDVYPPAKRELARHGIPCPHRYAVQITKQDVENYDLLIVMDGRNADNLRRMFGRLENVHKLMSFTDTPGDVSDPWYSGDFATAYSDIEKGCTGLLEYIIKR